MAGAVVRNDEWLSNWAVAELLHVSPKTVARWAKEGKLPHTKTLGGHRRFMRAEIEELAARMRVEVAT